MVLFILGKPNTNVPHPAHKIKTVNMIIKTGCELSSAESTASNINRPIGMTKSRLLATVSLIGLLYDIGNCIDQMQHFRVFR